MSAEALTSKLRLELEKTNAVFMRWQKSQIQWLGNQESEHDRILTETDCTMQALRLSEQQLDESRPLNIAIKEQQRKDVEQVYQQNESYKRQLVAMESQMRHFESQEEQSQQNLQQVRHEHDLLRQKMEHNLQDLTHGIRHYARLGLEFQKGDGDAMKFIFTQIDASNPQRQFYFVIFVDDRDRYQLVETSPALPAAQCSLLTAQLNETNDLATFTFRLRSLFVQACKNGAVV